MPMSVTAYRGDQQSGRNGDPQEPSLLETLIELSSRLTRDAAEVRRLKKGFSACMKAKIIS